MSDAKQPVEKPLPTTPPIDDRANQAFLDALVDTDGRPNREAEAIVEIEGFDDDGEPQ